ncbi:hypothetical protein FGB62_107g124 [Gracilaria domingensis]|nr:hypothetical protein FGB62_107g124 [Gracilaria domingensis]
MRKERPKGVGTIAIAGGPDEKQVDTVRVATADEILRHFAQQGDDNASRIRGFAPARSLATAHGPGDENASRTRGLAVARGLTKPGAARNDNARHARVHRAKHAPSKSEVRKSVLATHGKATARHVQDDKHVEITARFGPGSHAQEHHHALRTPPSQGTIWP